MRPLVVVRRATAFDPAFVARDVLFAPIAAAYRRIGPLSDFPEVDALGRVFAGDPPVRFVPAGVRRRRGESVDVAALYDARIAVDGVVPTRPRCWHDLMNALVWGTFPAAKHALHGRQHRAISAGLDPDARVLKPRTRELDALALVDEGGVVVLARDPEGASRALAARRPGALAALLEGGQARVVVFGHAIYESLALGARPAVVASVVAEWEPCARDVVAAADRHLAVALDDTRRFLTPQDLVRVDLAEARSEIG